MASERSAQSTSSTQALASNVCTEGQPVMRSSRDKASSAAARASPATPLRNSATPLSASTVRGVQNASGCVSRPALAARSSYVVEVRSSASSTIPRDRLRRIMPISPQDCARLSPERCPDMNAWRYMARDSVACPVMLARNASDTSACCHRWLSPLFSLASAHSRKASLALAKCEHPRSRVPVHRYTHTCPGVVIMVLKNASEVASPPAPPTPTPWFALSIMSRSSTSSTVCARAA
mmetsp:Transcript_29552/g.73787  ORF Transcript_29552/g.73787 Transcript_29552/m.73787 type:complete len:236 (-) Transcript_29552:5200-5907(-)